MKRDVDRLSPQQLHDSRRLWWDEDFSLFLWRRLNQYHIESVIDVGCGIGTFFQRMNSLMSGSTNFFGVDIDEARIRIAYRTAEEQEYSSRLHLLIGDICSLPFTDGSMDAGIAILTLQHLEKPESAVSELRRVLRREGVLICVEPDNVKQSISLPSYNSAFQEAQMVFWMEVRARYRPRDIAIGPRLPLLLLENGYDVQACKGFLVAHLTRESVGSFIDRSKQAFLNIGRRYAINPEAAIMKQLFETMERVEEEYHDYDGFYTITSVPLFLVEGIKGY